MRCAKLLDRRAIPLTPGDIPVRTDVFIHNLDAFTLEALRRAVMQGLTPGMERARPESAYRESRRESRSYSGSPCDRLAAGMLKSLDV
jgi:hypothetical protein